VCLFFSDPAVIIDFAEAKNMDETGLNIAKLYEVEMLSLCEAIRQNPRKLKKFPSTKLAEEQPFPNIEQCFRLSGENSNDITVTTNELQQEPGMMWCLKGIVLGQAVNKMCIFKFSVQVTSTEWLVPIEYRVGTEISASKDVDISMDSLLFMAKQVIYDEEKGTGNEPTHVMENGVVRCVKHCAPHSIVFLLVRASQQNAAYVKVMQEDLNECQLQEAFSLLGDLISFSIKLTSNQLVLIDEVSESDTNTSIHSYGDRIKVQKNLLDLDVVAQWYNGAMSIEALVKQEDLQIISDNDPLASALYILRSFCAFLFQMGNNDMTIEIPPYTHGESIDIKLVPFPWNQLHFTSMRDKFIHCKDPTNLCQFVEDRFPNFLNIMDSRKVFHISDACSVLGPDGEYAELPYQSASFKKKVSMFTCFHQCMF
jgi:hypothetical protein